MESSQTSMDVSTNNNNIPMSGVSTSVPLLSNENGIQVPVDNHVTPMDTTISTSTSTKGDNLTSSSSLPVKQSSEQSQSVPVPESDLSKLKPSDLNDPKQLGNILKMFQEQRDRDIKEVERLRQEAEQVHREAAIGRQALAKQKEQQEIEKQNKRNDFEKMLIDTITQRKHLHEVLKTDPNSDPLLEHLIIADSKFKSNPDDFMSLDNDVRTACAATSREFVLLETKNKEAETHKQEMERMKIELEKMQKANQEISETVNNALIFKGIQNYLKPSPFSQFKTNTDSQATSILPISQTNISNPNTSLSDNNNSTMQQYQNSLGMRFPFTNQLLTQQNQQQSVITTNSLTESAMQQVSQPAAYAASAASDNNTSQQQQKPVDYTKTMAEEYAAFSFQTILMARHNKDNDYVQRSSFAASQNSDFMNKQSVNHGQFNAGSVTPDLSLNDEKERPVSSDRIPFLHNQVPSAADWDPTMFNKIVKEGIQMGIGIAEQSRLKNQVGDYNRKNAYQRFGHNVPKELGNIAQSNGTVFRTLADEQNFIRLTTPTGITIV